MSPHPGTQYTDRRLGVKVAVLDNTEQLRPFCPGWSPTPDGTRYLLRKLPPTPILHYLRLSDPHRCHFFILNG
jgi:hypothetical protein